MRIFLDDLSLTKAHWLVKALRAGRLQSSLSELLLHVFARLAQPFATGFAAFHLVIRQDFYVIPPALPIKLRRLLRHRHGNHKNYRGKKTNHAYFSCHSGTRPGVQGAPAASISFCSFSKSDVISVRNLASCWSNSAAAIE